jgi:N-acyl-D-amino-acid deacylase
MTERMASWRVPGGQLAVARDDRLVYNRGFGYASVEDAELVEPDALFRIASTTKPITAVAILMLIDAGELSLDTPVFPLHPMSAVKWARSPNSSIATKLQKVHLSS